MEHFRRATGKVHISARIVITTTIWKPRTRQTRMQNTERVCSDARATTRKDELISCPFRVLTSTEQNYDKVHRECLDTVLPVVLLHPYLERAQFQNRIDQDAQDEFKRGRQYRNPCMHAGA